MISQTDFAVDLNEEPADYQAAILSNRMDCDMVVAGQAEAEAMSNRMKEKIR
jgi:hypothetical protein